MARTQRQVAGRVVAITGAGRGIGAATAGVLSRAGMRVAIGDLDLEAAERTAAGLYGETLALPLDVTDRASFGAFLDAAEAGLGPLDVLVNNAGIAHAAPSFADEDPAVIARTIEINLLGALTGTQLAIQRMLPRGHGQVVNIASVAGKTGPPGLVAYAASKHGVVGLTDTIAAELHDSGLDFTCVMPGPVDTQMMDGTHLVKAVRLITPDEVGAAVLDALRTGRPEVYVPRSLGTLVRYSGLLPRGVRHRLNRMLGVHKIYTDIDPARRAAYDARLVAPDAGTGPQ